MPGYVMDIVYGIDGCFYCIFSFDYEKNGEWYSNSYLICPDKGIIIGFDSTDEYTNGCAEFLNAFNKASTLRIDAYNKRYISALYRTYWRYFVLYCQVFTDTAFASRGGSDAAVVPLLERTREAEGRDMQDLRRRVLERSARSMPALQKRALYFISMRCGLKT